MTNNHVTFDVVHMPPENTNSVLVQSGGDCIVFDPWGRADDWVREIASRGLTLRAIYITHGHFDHISAAPQLAEKYGVPWFMNSADRILMPWNDQILDYYGMPTVAAATPATDLPIGRTEPLSGLGMDIIPMPGHTPGGVAFYFPAHDVLLSGDTVFANSVGRCDLPGGNMNTQMASIARLIDMNMPPHVRVIPGHGDTTTIADLHNKNPYFNSQA